MLISPQMQRKIKCKKLNIRKESGEFRKGRKNTKTKTVISIAHTLEIIVRESIRKKRAVKVGKESAKNGALMNYIKDRGLDRESLILTG